MQMDSLMIRQKKLHRRRSSWAGIIDPGAESRFQKTLSDFEAAHPYGDGERCWGCFFTEMSGSGMIPRM